MADLANQVLAPKVRDLFFDSSGNWIPSRYKVMHGGRGGLKSWGFARVGVLVAAKRKIRVLCGRELQTSIKESVHFTLKAQIEALGLESFFNVQQYSITSHTGSEFIFEGIKNDPKKIKSLEGIDICWIEEAENISEASWQVVIPTIRKPGSEIWVGFNPNLDTDPTAKRFIKSPPPNSRIIETNWRDNPWLSDELKQEKDYLARVDPDAYQHVWEGGFRVNGAAQVLSGKFVIEDFEPEVGAWQGPYQGADWGFSQDPTAMVRMWIHHRQLFIEHEAYGIGVDIDKTAALFDKIPFARLYTIRADNARPETISYVKRDGYPKLVAVEKWPGSVEDGVAFLRQFERIVIHPRCTHAAQEAKLWSYKVDRLSGDVLPDLVDAHNHIWDAVRYGLEPMIKQGGTWTFASI